MIRRWDVIAGVVIALGTWGCHAPEASLAPPYQQARLVFEQHVTSSTTPFGDAGRMSPPDSPERAGETPPAHASTPQQGDGGNAAPSGSGVQRGRVLGFARGEAAPEPLAGATVRTSDGRTTTTDDNGRFTLPGGWPADGTWSVMQPGYRASTVVGLPKEDDLKLHLKAEPTFQAPAPPIYAHRFTVGGQVVDPSGMGLEGVTLLLGADDGSHAGSTTTDAAGRFEMQIAGHGAQVENATIVALDTELGAWIGAATGLDIASGAAAIDFSPSHSGVDPLVMRPTTHELKIDVDDAGTGLSPRVFVDVAFAKSSHRILLFGHENTVRLAQLPGAQFGVEVEAADSMRSRQSMFVQRHVPIDFATAQTSFTATLLVPPQVQPLDTRSAARTIQWNAVPGARHYEVRLNSVSRRSLEWEGFTSSTSLLLDTVGARLSGRYALQVVAWDAELTPRQVASVGRQLRVLPLPKQYRWAVSEAHLEY